MGLSCGRETGPYLISNGELESNVAAGIACAAEGIESLFSLHPANSPAPLPWLRPRSEESLRRIPLASPAGTSCGMGTGPYLISRGELESNEAAGTACARIEFSPLLRPGDEESPAATFPFS
jgi:hypothetical protein